MSGLFDDIPSVPDSAINLLEIDCIKRKYKTPQHFADEMLGCVKRWIRAHPNRYPTDIIPPDWRDYILYNITT